MGKKKVWLMNHYATNMFFNKGGRHYWFAENLLKNGYEPTIFCANTRHNRGDTIVIPKGKYIKMTTENIPFVIVKTVNYSGNGIQRINNMLMFAWNLFSIAKEYSRNFGKPDVILASSVHPLTLVAGIKIAKNFGIPCICEIRDLWPEAIFSFNNIREKSALGKILKAGEHWIYRKADALIFTKEGDIDYIKENKWDLEQGGDIDLDKAFYINNGVDIDAFNKSIKENTIEDSDLEKERYNVVYIGAIRPVNNVGKIIDAAVLLKENEDIQFLIYGDGNQRGILGKRVADEGLSNVKIKGYVNKKYVPYILSKSYVNILNYSPTLYNWSRGSSSNKLFEYMASGKPLISTVKTGYSIIDKYKCGFELEHGTAEELAKAIIKIKRMPEREYIELGQNARIGALDFDFKVLTKKLLEVIEKVLS